MVKRGKLLTGLLIFSFFGILFALISDFQEGFPEWYRHFYPFALIINLLLNIGLWYMRKIAAWGWLIFTLINQGVGLTALYPRYSELHLSFFVFAVLFYDGLWGLALWRKRRNLT